MDGTYKQDENGEWVEADEIPMQGWKAKLEQWFLMWGFPRLANFMARWDERGLGK